MCGVYGIVSESLSKDEIYNRLVKMGELQRHRGPDDQKQAVYSATNNDTRKHVGLGFVRLSILDLETGMQPICSSKDKTTIVCNGQIYNYVELKNEVKDEHFKTKGDIEVGLHLYRKKGIDFLQSLNGMYAGAIFDPNKNKIYLFRDRFGIKPLYYTTWENNFAFASEIKPILFGSKRPIEINQTRLFTYFTYRYIPGEDTMFEGVKCLPPGSFLEYDLNTKKFQIHRYWEYKSEYKVNSNMKLDDAAEKFNYLLEDAVKIRLRSDVEVGSLISSGIDSASVTSIAAFKKPDLKLYTMAFKENVYNELPMVEKFLKANKHLNSVSFKSKICGKDALKRLSSVVRAVEDPISLGTLVPTDQLCEMVKQDLKVVLTGEGADEIFAGYRKTAIEMAAAKFNDMSSRYKKDILAFYPELENYMKIRKQDPFERYIQSELLFSNDELTTLLGNAPPSNVTPYDAVPKLTGNEHPLNQLLAMECRFRLPDYVILRLDKLSMKNSLETRTPYLDYRMAEFAATLPVEFKVNLDLKQEKFISRYSNEKYGILDPVTARQEKLPFTIPMADWFSEPETLPDDIKDIIFGDVIKKQGVLNEEFAKKLTNTVTSKGVDSNTLVSGADRVYAIVIFTLWYDEFFNKGIN